MHILHLLLFLRLKDGEALKDITPVACFDTKLYWTDDYYWWCCCFVVLVSLLIPSRRGKAQCVPCDLWSFVFYYFKKWKTHCKTVLFQIVTVPFCTGWPSMKGHVPYILSHPVCLCLSMSQVGHTNSLDVTSCHTFHCHTISLPISLSRYDWIWSKSCLTLLC